ncbi:MAG: glycosyltransferase family 2 protein, partial [Ilumatobacteraceae bacterium]
MGSSDSARLRPDSTWWRRRTGDSDVVVAGSPLGVFRIGARGHGAIDFLERGGWPDAADELVARLISAGAVHPLPVGLEAMSEVTVVIPARDEDHANLRCLVEAFGDCASVVIVDDGSRIPLPELSGSRVLRCDTSGGPATARHAGLAAVAPRKGWVWD